LFIGGWVVKVGGWLEVGGFGSPIGGVAVVQAVVSRIKRSFLIIEEKTCQVFKT